MTLFRFATIMITSLSMALAFSHLMQLPPRMSFDGPTWITTQRLFPLYGSVGSFLEIGSVLFAGLSAYFVRASPAFGWTLAAAICLALALAVWIAFVAPANGQISQWKPDSFPSNWMRWRMQWEYAHAVRAVFQVVGLSFLIQSIMAEIKQA